MQWWLKNKQQKAAGDNVDRGRGYYRGRVNLSIPLGKTNASVTSIGLTGAGYKSDGDSLHSWNWFSHWASVILLLYMFDYKYKYFITYRVHVLYIYKKKSTMSPIFDSKWQQDCRQTQRHLHRRTDRQHDRQEMFWLAWTPSRVHTPRHNIMNERYAQCPSVIHYRLQGGGGTS